jgi:hypothetical protein
MVNRLKEYFDPSDERPPDDDYYVVRQRYGEFYVTRDVAERILADLASSEPPAWIRFIDVYGSSVCVRSCMIHSVWECTVAQRALERQFHRARRLEEKADRRPWEDDD